MDMWLNGGIGDDVLIERAAMNTYFKKAEIRMEESTHTG